MPQSDHSALPLGIKAWLSAVLFAAGLNFLPFEVVGEVRLFLGAFVVMPFVLSRSLPWAVAAAALAMVPSWVTPRPPIEFSVAVVEAVWLAVSCRKWRLNAVLADFAFWVVVGFPVGLWLHSGWAGLPADLALVAIVAHAATALTAVTVAHFVLVYTTFGSKISGEPAGRSSVRGVIFNYVFILSLVPLMTVALGFTLYFRHQAETDAEDQAFYATQETRAQIDLFFDLHRAALVALAESLERVPEQGPLLLDQVRRAHPNFLTMLTTDAVGRIKLTSPAETTAALAGSSVADRPYFQVAKETRRPFVSGVFVGRGFGQDILVAISVPMFDSAGAFQGIVEASVAVASLANLAANTGTKGATQLIIADAAGQVIQAHELTSLKPLQALQETPLAPALRQGTGLIPFVTDRVEPDGTRRRVRNRAERCRSVGMVIIAQWPVLSGLAGMKTAYAGMFFTLAGLAGSALLVARTAQRRLARPLENFAEHTRQLTAAGAIDPLGAPDNKAPQEVARVYETFNRLAERLHTAHEELKKQNAELDQRVAERTRDAENARVEAERANRSKTNFLAMASHELRTPLNAIIGLSEKVDTRPLSEADAKRLQTVRDSGQRLLGVVNDLLEVSRAEAGKLELQTAALELGALAADLQALFSLRAEQQGLRLEVRPPSESPLWVATDGARLQQVLINLIGNALKFTATGGVICRVEITGREPNALRVRFAVTDTGAGLSAADQARLFQPFVQLAQSGRTVERGSGLGLYISRQLVDLLGGTLEVRSAPGAGAEFHFTLLLPVAPPPVATPSAAPTVSSLQTLRVLAADDNAANQAVLEGLLEGQCAQLVIVGDGAAALRALRQNRFDVALLDLEMPEVDGLNVARTYHTESAANPRRCRLIAFSAYNRSQVWPRCLEAGFEDFVEKPINRRELYRALAGSSPASPP